MQSDRSASPAPRRGLGRLLTRAGQDVASQTSGLLVIIVSGAIFAGAAVGGLTLVGSLGAFGWIAYAMVLGVIALALGPVFVVGMKVRLRGSPRHRAEIEERLQAQRVKYGLDSAKPISQDPVSRRSTRHAPREGSR